jgi:hypothetical protein
MGGDAWNDDPVRIAGVTEELDPDQLLLFWGKKDDWQLFLPHWVLLLAVALPWLGLFVWRARRRARAVKEFEG